MNDQVKTGLSITELLADKSEEILELAARHKAYNIRVFGSVVRGQATPDSDIDFLVNFQPDYKLRDHIGLKQDLEVLLGHKVDVSNQDTLRPEFSRNIMQSARPLLAFIANPTIQEEEFVKDEKVYLSDILQRIESIATYTVDGKEAFLGSALIQDAVIRSFEVIGEVVKRLSPESTQAQPQVEWNKIAGFRDFLIHHYDRVDPDLIWAYVENYLPPLKNAIQNMLEQTDKNTPET